MSDSSGTFLPRVARKTKDPVRSVFDVVPTISAEEEESAAQRLLTMLKTGEISVSSLMGPLFGEGHMSATLPVPPGDKTPLSSALPCTFEPSDSSNDLLVENVCPPDYVNPEPLEEYDIVVIGAGVSGLLSVITGKWLGKKCALIERHAMGGDCLNIGCVPSKAVIAAANAFRKVHEVERFGIKLPEGKPSIDFSVVMKRMREIRSQISHHDSVSRYARDFCEHVYIGNAEFANDQCVVVTDRHGSTRRLRYKKAMIATGASAYQPPPLVEIPHLTNSNFFNLTELPPRMLVVGSGPIGLEMAQAMSVFGCKVTCFERGSRILSREDPDAVKILAEQLQKDGVGVMCNCTVTKVEIVGDNDVSDISLYKAPFPTYKVTYFDSTTKQSQTTHCEAILNATGRVPNVFGLGLDCVNVDFDNRKGVMINEHFRTSNKDIYACGDCATEYKFTHSADFQARLAIRNMILGDSNHQSDLLVPWCTYTHPEIAHVGKYESELEKNGEQFETFIRHLSPVDRCMCDGVDQGFIKILVQTGSDKIIGATICGERAGDMISEITVCMQHGVGLAELAGTIHPYPTTQEAVRQCALGIYKHYKDPSGLALKVLRMLAREVELSNESTKAT